MTSTSPYGAWPSPITPAMLAGGQVSYWGITADGDDLVWGEFRPSEAGRVALVQRTVDGPRDLLPDFSARTLAHEYGGVSFAMSAGKMVAASLGDQRIYRLDGDAPVPITPDPPTPRGWRYADTVFLGDDVIAVREDHTGDGEAVAAIVRVAADGSVEPEVLIQGHDFYAAPTPSPDGAQLAWIAWNHPNMPWDHTELWVADLTGDGVENARVLPTDGEAFVQPAWSPDGSLHVVTDRTGWWNIHRVEGDLLVNLCDAQREFGDPAWLFGFRTYGFLDDGTLVALSAEKGVWSLGTVTDGTFNDFGLPGRASFSGWMAIGDDRVWVAMGGPALPTSILEVTADGHVEVVATSTSVDVPPTAVSTPRAIEFPTSDDTTSHAFFYPPTSATHAGPEGSLPPLLVMSHGGPTSQTQASFNLGIQFWTTRGFAVADVNYRGSTGFGREYRNSLQGRWGDVDVVDCVRAAEYLAGEGLVDRDHMAIRGGSAGGYITLCAMTFHDTFAAGASYCGVADIQALMATTHKFESRYDESLIGPMPEAAQLAHDRSPIHFADRISAPLLVVQGAEDPIVTPDQAEVMVDAMRVNGVPHAYLLMEGEDHFLAKSETVVTTREAELSFYGQLFGFEPAGEISPVKIEGR